VSALARMTPMGPSTSSPARRRKPPRL
jgi:hypothetical protein